MKYRSTLKQLTGIALALSILGLPASAQENSKPQISIEDVYELQGPPVLEIDPAFELPIDGELPPGNVIVDPPFDEYVEPKVIMSLQYLSDDDVYETIDIFSNQIDPNSFAFNQQTYAVMDGAKIFVPSSLLDELLKVRRNLSYDTFTGGIKKAELGEMRCMLGGPAMGRVLYTRYIEYSDNYEMTELGMKPVYSEGDNCLFEHFYSPKNEHSETAAARTMALLEAIIAFTKPEEKMEVQPIPG